MKRISAVLALSALAACDNGGGIEDRVCLECLNLDQQVDGYQAEGAVLLEAIDPQLCVNNKGALVSFISKKEAFEDVFLSAGETETGRVDATSGQELEDRMFFTPDPYVVKQGGGDASSPDMDCFGNKVFVAWEDTRDGITGYKNIRFQASQDNGATWMPEDVAVDDDPDGNFISLNPQVLLAQNNGANARIFVSWFDQVEGPPDVYVSASNDGGMTFAEPVRVSGAREGGAGLAWSGNQSMAFGSGRLHVAYEDMRNQGRQDIYYAFSGNGGAAFNPERRIDVGDDEGEHYSFQPRLAASDNHVYVVWHDNRGGEARDIFINYSVDGGLTWLEDAVRVDVGDNGPGFHESLNPDIVVEGDTAHIAWQDARNGAYDIFYAKVVAGEVVGEPERVDRSPKGQANAARPKIAIGGDHLVVAWQDYRHDPDSTLNELVYNYMDLSAEEPEFSAEDYRLDSSFEASSYALNHSIVVREGKVYTAWEDGRRGVSNIFFSEVEVGMGVDTLSDVQALEDILAAQEAEAQGQ